jgi:hypothetical protein
LSLETVGDRGGRVLTKLQVVNRLRGILCAGNAGLGG